MLRIVFSTFFSLGAATLLFFSNPVQAEMVTVTVGFESLYDEIGRNTAWVSAGAGRDTQAYPEGFGSQKLTTDAYGSPILQTVFDVDGVSFHNNVNQSWGSWMGTGLSTKTDTVYNSYFNEMASMTGSGNNGSNVYGVIYGESMDGLPYDSPFLPSIWFEPGVELVSMAITNTVYTAYTLGNIDPNGFATPGGYLDLYIYGLDENGDFKGKVTQNLGSNYDILTDWVTVDLSSLTGSTELRFAFASDDILNHGGNSWLNYPVYFAFDDITYRYDDGTTAATPEPGSLLIFGMGLAGLGIARRRSRRKNS